MRAVVDSPAAASSSVKIVALAPNAWAGPWMNRQQLLSRVGRRWPVLYSVGPSAAVQHEQPAWLPAIVQTDNVLVDLPARWMHKAARARALRTITLSAMARRWRRALLTGPGDVLLAWCFHPKFWPLVDHLRPDRLIYHAYDLYHQQGHWGPERAGFERNFLERAHLVLASSRQIAQYLRDRGAASVVVVENAADYDAFAIDPERTTEPGDLSGVPHPRVGYVGALNRKVDFALLLKIAQRRPAWHFVFVGAVGNLDRETGAAIEGLKALGNVHFLGFKPHRDLPAYVTHMDVNLLAYRLGDGVWSEGIYPLKLHEYLASGRPVVSADLPSVRPFGDVVRIAKSDSDWESSIAAALCGSAEGVPARRRVARENDWQARVNLIEDQIARLSAR